LIALLVAPCALQAKMIEDVAGNKIEIADNVQRIADLWNANNQIVLLLGGMDKVVGDYQLYSRSSLVCGSLS
jgi:ABC transporter, substrate-binding protein